MAKPAGANFSVTIDTKEMQRVIRETPQRASDFLDAEAEQMVNNIKLSFGVSPSLPGEPPGVDTGALRASITWRKVAQLIRHIQDGVEYGVMLELGTEFIAPRPFMGPEFERTRTRIGDDARKFGIVK